jgi:hypothetical protein
VSKRVSVFGAKPGETRTLLPGDSMVEREIAKAARVPDPGNAEVN